MATGPIRRMRTATAAQRGAANREAASATVPARVNPIKKSHTEVVGKGFVATNYSRSRVTIDETDREVEGSRRTFAPGEEVAYVKIGAGCTINMQNFESLRIDCAVTLPCLPHEIDQAAEEASQFVYERMTEEQIRWLGDGNKRF
jgi:hypothetical protein